MAGDTSASPTHPMIRRARPDEAAALSDLAMRSKGHWGYDATFLAACRDDLTLSADDIAASAVYLAEGSNGPAGFYTLRVQADGVAELDDLFVEPAAIGQGVGRRLWQHAVANAAALGCSAMILQSDPQAEGFYRAMGATRVGESASTVFPGRILPLMRYAIPASGLSDEVGPGSDEPIPRPPATPPESRRGELI